jgi:hypothetical protein
MEEDKGRRRKEGEGTRGGEGRGGQQKRGKGQGPVRCLADRRPCNLPMC